MRGGGRGRVQVTDDRGETGGAAVLAACAVGLAASLFVLAASCFPGGGYNPFGRMLSALGRTEIRLVTYPWCHWFFLSGMIVAAIGVIGIAGCGALPLKGAMLHAGGLVLIALAPEDTHGVLHNVGCWIAAAGGGAMLIDWWRRGAATARAKRLWGAVLALPLLALAGALAAHAVGMARFAPWVPTAQKILILSFVAWLYWLSAGRVRGWTRFWSIVPLLLPLAVAGCCAFGRSSTAVMLPLDGIAADDRVERLPLTEDERAGLAWLEHITGPLPAAEEKDLWEIGGRQYGIFVKRYNIAFAGYAAAAIGMRGDRTIRTRAGRILGHCVERMLRTDVWAYSQAANYWGDKPWAPDPCYRENVMYTGHLLQLLAYYELFTGNRRYHRSGGGWDFVWKDGRRVHYDVERLIDVTVEQMRKGPNGGISCEPGLMFFACNNHPHVALSVFRTLGCGDWSDDARRWEKWALGHYLSPAFGGGLFNLVYHVRGNFMYPRGQNAFDGWCLLWYEAWASDRRVPKALWLKARELIDRSRLENGDDHLADGGCCDPQPVPPSLTAAFLAATARACGDDATAAWLEKLVDDRYLRRDNGWFRLELDRRWRIGATAMRLISLAESHGSRFRDLVRRLPPN